MGQQTYTIGRKVKNGMLYRVQVPLFFFKAENLVITGPTFARRKKVRIRTQVLHVGEQKGVEDTLKA